MSDELTPQIVLWTGVGFCALGAGLLTWAVRILQSRGRREASASRAIGRVVENRFELDMENGRRVYPIVEFVTAEGETRRVECLWTGQVEHAVGAEVTVYYDPLHPAQAGIVGEGRLGPALLVAFASVTLAAGLLMLVAGALGFPPAG